MLKMKTILVPVDFSEESKLAVNWASRLVHGVPDVQVYLCHVIKPNISGFSEADVVSCEYRGLGRDAAHKRLEQWEKLLPRGTRRYSLLGFGDPVKEILRVCKDKQVDLVVMTTHGRRGLDYLMHGSVAEHVVRLASCQVLVLHLNDAMKKECTAVA
jgi:nucleotide-binding universal stress UspA family protein